MKKILPLLALFPLLLTGAKPMTDSPALKFEDPAHAAFFARAKTCIDAMHADWHHHPFTRGGNFYRAKWCRGAGARDDCQIASGTADRRDQLAIRLYTLFYGDKFPDVFGYGLQFLKTPEAAGWGVNFSFNLGGKSITGENFNLQFRRYPKATGSEDLLLYVGAGARYQVARTAIRVRGIPADEAPARLLKDAASLQAGALAQVEALEAKVLAAIAKDEVEACDWGKYEGDGIPPPCYPRKLKPEEKAAELQKAKEFFSAQKQGWKESGKTLWKMLHDSLPLTCLWPRG